MIIHKYWVERKGPGIPFPVELLTVERAWPATVLDARNIEDSIRECRGIGLLDDSTGVIQLASYQICKPKQWEIYNWQVISK